METIVSAVLGDLLTRSISFIIDKYCRQQPSAEEIQQRLRCMLLRVQAIVEEAEGRHITNQAMLRQHQVLRIAMYQGYYLLDIVKYRIRQQESSRDKEGAGSSALTRFSSAKRLCFSSRRMNMEFLSDGVKEVKMMLSSLHSTINDMEGFIIFLKSYPPISREPYNKYLFMETCMFGRQAEMEKIINFLLQPEPPGANTFQVLPIIGPPRVGKSTLVEHVCHDERVRRHFSLIILFSGDPTAPEGSGVVKNQTHGSHERSLIVMELADDLVLDERQYIKLLSSRIHMPPGSKVIVTSRSDNIVKLGTTEAIRLNYLRHEAYWYFFKVMAFGSTNPDEHPELASIAMELAAELDGSFMSANVIGGILRANTQTRFWRRILELERKHVERNVLLLGERPHTLVRKNKTVYLWSLSKTSMTFKGLHCQTHFSQNNAPKATLHDAHATSSKSYGKHELLLWKSRIPPYHSYTMTCEMEAPQRTMTKKKRPHSMV